MRTPRRDLRHGRERREPCYGALTGIWTWDGFNSNVLRRRTRRQVPTAVGYVVGISAYLLLKPSQVQMPEIGP